MPVLIREVGSNRRHRSKALLHWVARSGLLLTLALTIALPASAVSLDGANEPLKTKIKEDIKNCAKSSKIKEYEIKTNWQEGKLSNRMTFIRLSNTKPETVAKKGFDPKNNIEAIFKYDKTTEYKIFTFQSSPTCVFVFAYPGTISKSDKFIGEIDGKNVPSALKKLGWGTSQYLYEFELPTGTKYASDNGKVSDKSEIAFPQPITPAQIKSAWKKDGNRYKSVDFRR